MGGVPNQAAALGRGGVVRLVACLLGRRAAGTRGRRLASGSIWLRLLIGAVLVVSATGPLGVAPAGADSLSQTAPLADEEPVVVGGTVAGLHFRQTGGGTGLGYDVRDAFLTALNELGGPAAAGYPVSAPFQGVDGCGYQALQVALLQLCPGLPLQLANTFQILEEAGADGRLEELGIGRGQTDESTSFEEAVRIRLGWLEDAGIKERYLSQCGNGDANAAIQFCGLPMNQPRQFGPFISQRFQRITFQRWVEAVPGMPAPGTITPVLGGDLLKQTGVLAGAVTRPHPLGQPPVATIVEFSRPGSGTGAPDAPGAPGGSTGSTTAPPVLPGLNVIQPAPAAPTAPTVPARAGARTIPLSYGFQGEFFITSRRPEAINLIKNSGFGWAKQQVIWKQYEIGASECGAEGANCLQTSVNGRSKYFRKNQLGFLDAVVDELSASGLRVLVGVVGAPHHYAVPDGHTPADPNMLRDFLQFIATRYRGKVQAIEPWNEQNLAGEWGSSRLWPNAPATPPQGVVDFLALQKAAYGGIKAADPSIIVVLAALTPTGAPPPLAIDDRDYLDYLLQVNGGEVKNYYDVVGVHPSGFNNPPDDFTDVKTVPTNNYKVHPSFYIKRYQQLRDVQLKHGDTKPMWFTEVGWSVTRIPVSGYEYGMDNTEAARGRYFARLLEQVHNEAPYVTNVIIWNLNFRSVVGETDEKFGFGIVNADGNPTSAYACVADFVRGGNRITRPECR
ncbi:MAG: hypothetical protein HY332_16055 [Chloroflexi bacterium]|nr:hypothetical protein [Chloroflexota bacterium]